MEISRCSSTSLEMPFRPCPTAASCACTYFESEARPISAQRSVFQLRHRYGNSIPENANTSLSLSSRPNRRRVLGLGLWISKGIVQKYGGAIRFRSSSVTGRNITCFQVMLPDANVQRTSQPNLPTSEAVGVLNDR